MVAERLVPEPGAEHKRWRRKVEDDIEQRGIPRGCLRVPASGRILAEDLVVACECQLREESALVACECPPGSRRRQLGWLESVRLANL